VCVCVCVCVCLYIYINVCVCVCVCWKFKFFSNTSEGLFLRILEQNFQVILHILSGFCSELQSRCFSKHCYSNSLFSVHTACLIRLNIFCYRLALSLPKRYRTLFTILKLL